MIVISRLPPSAYKIYIYTVKHFFGKEDLHILKKYRTGRERILLGSGLKNLVE